MLLCGVVAAAAAAVCPPLAFRPPPRPPLPLPLGVGGVADVVPPHLPRLPLTAPLFGLE